MNLLKHLQFTLNNIFDLYIGHGRKYYGFTMLFTIFGCIACFILALIFVVLYNMVNGDLYGDMLWEIPLGRHGHEFLQDCFGLLLCLSIGVFSLCIRISGEQLPEKLTFAQAFKRVGSETWLYFALSAVGGSLFLFIVNDQLIYSSRPGSNTFDNLLDQAFGIWKYWLEDLFRYFKFFLPSILSYYVIRMHLRKQGVYTEKTHRNSVFWTVIVLTFFIQSLSLAAIGMVQNLFMQPLIRLFDSGMLIPVVLTVCLYIFILAHFYLGLAGAMVYPFLFKPERSIREDGNLDEL